MAVFDIIVVGSGMGGMSCAAALARTGHKAVVSNIGARETVLRLLPADLGFYGLENTPRRMMSGALRMKTPVPGLYLSGQDVVTPGIFGAMWGGLLAAASIDPQIFLRLHG